MLYGNTKHVINQILEMDKNANQYRLAKALGCSKQAVNAWTKGRAKISETLYKRLLKIYPNIEITDYVPVTFPLGSL